MNMKTNDSEVKQDTTMSSLINSKHFGSVPLVENINFSKATQKFVVLNNQGGLYDYVDTYAEALVRLEDYLEDLTADERTSEEQFESTLQEDDEHWGILADIDISNPPDYDELYEGLGLDEEGESDEDEDTYAMDLLRQMGLDFLLDPPLIEYDEEDGEDDEDDRVHREVFTDADGNYYPIAMDVTVKIDGTPKEFAKDVSRVVAGMIEDYLRVSRNAE